MKCSVEIDLGSDECSFACWLEEGHWGPHQSMGDIDNIPYLLQWGFAGEQLTSSEAAYRLSATNNSVYKD